MHEGLKSSKDFKCDSCEKSFQSAQQLRWHIKNIHEGIQNKCDFCENTCQKTLRTCLEVSYDNNNSA